MLCVCLIVYDQLVRVRRLQHLANRVGHMIDFILVLILLLLTYVLSLLNNVVSQFCLILQHQLLLFRERSFGVIWSSLTGN